MRLTIVFMVVVAAAAYDDLVKENSIQTRNADCDSDDRLFLCEKTNKCISKSKLCDGISDCGDWNDERICDCTLPDMFWCGYRCIPNSLVCDGFSHCPDDDDEMYCGDQCNGFQCKSGRCISAELRCNYEADCNFQGDFFAGLLSYRHERDLSDEKGCACDKPTDYVCANDVCIDTSRLCDTLNDCGDWSDEAPGGYPCEYGNCEETQFQCNNGGCIDSVSRCNGYLECSDGSDEMNCDRCMSRSDTIKCSNGVCVEPQFVCDGIRHCGKDDVSDELWCDCPERAFHCDNGMCIDSHKMCDGRDDCGDLSDELACFCTDDSFVCDNQRCVPQQVVCDGVDNCRDASDERHCGNTCKLGEFQCDNGVCISQTDRCDNNGGSGGEFDCSDYSDEVNCKCSEYMYDHLCGNGICARVLFKDHDVYSWSDYDGSGDRDWGFINTEDHGVTVENMLRCDHPDVHNTAEHCPDYSDTIGCNSDCQDSSEFLCDYGLCISAEFRCDGHFHCLDKSDEKNCECTGNLLDCGEDYCIPVSYRCDDQYDCADGRDELNCDDHGTCDQNNDGCQHECVTTERSYYCKCRDGYHLKSDWKTCEFLCDGPNSKCLDCIHYDIHAEKVNWQSAKQRCEDDGGQLAMIKTSYIHIQIREHILTHNLDNEVTGFWIGLSDLDVEGVFKWVDGSLLSDTGFAKWAGRNPNNNTKRDAVHGQDCVHMWTRRDLKWDDGYCGDFKRRRGFICQYNICK